MAVAKATLIRRTRQLVGDRPWETNLVSGITDADDTIEVPDGTKWARGATGEFQDTGEQFLVRDVEDDILTVKRGHRGTEAATHGVNTSIVRDPEYTFIEIADTLDGVIRSLWPYAWKGVGAAVTPDPATTWYPLPEEALDLLSVAQVDDTGDVREYGSHGYPVHFKRRLPTQLSASGVGVKFTSRWHESNQIHITFQAKITPVMSGNDYTDLEEGLMEEVVAYGAAARLAVAKEIPLTVMDDEGAMPPQARLTAGDYMQRHHQRLLNQLNEEMWELLPPMFKFRR